MTKLSIPALFSSFIYTLVLVILVFLIINFLAGITGINVNSSLTQGIILPLSLVVWFWQYKRAKQIKSQEKLEPKKIGNSSFYVVIALIAVVFVTLFIFWNFWLTIGG